MADALQVPKGITLKPPQQPQQQPVAPKGITMPPPADPAQNVLPAEPLQPMPGARIPYTPMPADPTQDPLLAKLQAMPWESMSQEETMRRAILENPNRLGVEKWLVRFMQPIEDFTLPIEKGSRFGLDEEIAGLGAGVENTLQNLFGDEPTGKGFWDAFSEREAIEQAGYERTVAEHPFPKTAEFIGSLAAGGPAGEAVSAARATAGQAFKQGAKAGALGGGLTGFGETQGDIVDKLKGAGVGTVAGAGLGGSLSALVPGIPNFIRRMFGGATEDALSRTASNVGAMEASGMTPSLLAASTSKPAGWLAKASATAPFVGDFAEASARRSLQEGGEAVERVASQYGGAAGTREAGQAAQAGVQRFAGEKPLPGAMTLAEAQRIAQQSTGVSSFKEKETALYTLAENLIPQGQRFRPRETVVALNNLTNRFRSNRALNTSQATPALRQMFEDLTGPHGQQGLGFGELQQLRTRIGEGLKDPKLFPEVGQQELRLLYGALSRDLDDAAMRADPTGRASQLWDRANKYAEAGRAQFEKLEALTGAQNPEQAFSALVNASRSGIGKGNLALLNAARRSMGEEAWNEVAAGLMREMGQATKGASLTGEVSREFSPTTFMTNYAGLSAEAKDRIFGTGPRRQALETLAQVFGQEKATARLANVSNTANQNQSIAWFLTLPASLPAWGGAAGVTKAMTSPKFARWVAAGMRPMTPAARAAHLQRLAGIGRTLGWSEAQLQAALGAFSTPPQQQQQLPQQANPMP